MEPLSGLGSPVKQSHWAKESGKPSPASTHCNSINLTDTGERALHPDSGNLDADFSISINLPSDIASEHLGFLTYQIEIMK